MSKVFSFSFAAAMAVAFMLIQSPRGVAFAQEGGAATKANLDLPFDAEGNEEDEEEAPEIIIFYGQQYEGDGIFFCCDRSGSMKEDGKWPHLQKEVVKNITQFSDRVQFSLVFFDSGMVKFPTSGRPADANPALKAAAISMVMSTSPGSGTCTKPALFASLQFANLSTSKRKLIIYLSDGWQHCNGADNNTYGNECLNEVTQRNTSRVHINTICIGVSVDENWMRKLAAQNNGQFARIR